MGPVSCCLMCQLLPLLCSVFPVFLCVSLRCVCVCLLVVCGCSVCVAVSWGNEQMPRECAQRRAARVCSYVFRVPPCTSPATAHAHCLPPQQHCAPQQQPSPPQVPATDQAAAHRLRSPLPTTSCSGLTTADPRHTKSRHQHPSTTAREEDTNIHPRAPTTNTSADGRSSTSSEGHSAALTLEPRYSMLRWTYVEQLHHACHCGSAVS